MRIVVLLFVLLIFSTKINAVGIGITGGTSPKIGISLANGNVANQYSLAVSWQSGIYVHADYKRNFYILGKNVPLFLGIGGRFQSNNTDFGIRIPFGIAFYFSKLEVFGELAPTLGLKNLDFDTSPPCALGVRFHFNP